MGSFFRYSVFTGIAISVILALASCQDLLNEFDSDRYPLHVQLIITSSSTHGVSTDQQVLPEINNIEFHISGTSIYTPNGNVYSLPYSTTPIVLNRVDTLGWISQTSTPVANYSDFDLAFGTLPSENNPQVAVHITGSLNGNPFVYEITEPFFLNFEMAPPLMPGKGKDSLSVLVISFDYSNWLMAEDITGKTQASEAEVIERIIESATLEIFESGTKTGGGNPKNEGRVGLSNNPVVAESAGNALFIASLSEASEDTVFIDFRTKSNSAKDGEDFADSAGTLILEAGVREGVISIAVFDDDKWEPDQKFTLLLTDARGAAIDKSKAQAMATILNDDLRQ